MSETVRNIPGGLLIGITGGIACGKSEVGRILKDAGAEVRDTDRMAHEAIAPGGPAYEQVVAHFGRGILHRDQTVDRAVLGERVFANDAERDALNAIVHPHVRNAWRAWAEEIRRNNRVGAVMIPLLFEVGADRDVDVVVCVAATDERVMERSAARRLTPDQARARMKAQMPLNEKKEKADYVIENNGTLEELKETTHNILQTILKKENK